MSDDGEVWPVKAHGVQYELWTWPGKIRRNLRLGRPYEQKLLEHIYERGFTGVAVDGGANLGNHTLWFAAVCGLQTYAFEPVFPSQLLGNVYLNARLITPGVNVIVEPYGLYDREATAWHQGRGRLGKRDTGGPKLKLRTLDSYNLRGVSLIKLDVEGTEPAALRGAAATIRRCQPVVFSEEWGKKERAHAAAVMEPLGYERTGGIKCGSGGTMMGCWEPE